MKNIEQILGEVEGLTDEQKSEITKGVTENYRTVAEVKTKTDRITELEGEVSTYKESIEALEGDSKKLDELKAKVAEYEEAEEKRKAEAEEQAKATAFEKNFDDAIKNRSAEQGNSFVNDMMRDSVLTKVRKMCAEDESKGIAEAIDAVTKDVSGVWKNPQQPVHKMPNNTGAAGEDSTEDKRTMANFLRGIV